jgi:phosphorylcholine metabolism protein LicD
MNFIKRILRLIKYKIIFYIYSPLSRAKAKYLHENGVKVLGDISTLFKHEKIHHWIDGGTLLGIVRDKKLIDSDIDIDIGVLTDDPEALYSVLIGNRFHICYFYEDLKGSKCIIRAEKYNVGIDFEIFTKNRNSYYRDSPRKLPESVKSADGNKLAVLRYEFDKILIDSLSKCIFSGVELNIPKHYDKYLSVYYSNWKVRESLQEYTESTYVQPVNDYMHHNNKAYYKHDEFLYIYQVAPSTIKNYFTNVIIFLKECLPFKGKKMNNNLSSEKAKDVGY